MVDFRIRSRRGRGQGARVPGASLRRWAAPVLALAASSPSSAFAQAAPTAPGATEPARPAPTPGAAPATPTPGAAPSAPAPGAAPPQGGNGASAPAGAPKPAGKGESEELTMTIAPAAAPRPQDMAAFAAQSEQELKIVGVRERYSLNLFGDVYGYTEGGTRRKFNPTFGTGGFSMLFTGSLGSGIRLTAEPLMEFADNAPVIDLERLQLRWTWRGFFIDAGRSHVDLGYWNVAYHHGKWLQPTIDRPRLLLFEDDGGILPIHWVGMTVGYGFDVGTARVSGSLSVGNSRGSIVDDIQNSVDGSRDKQYSGKLEVKGIGHKELRVGVSGVYGRIGPQPAEVRPALPDTRMFETIGNAYIALPVEPFFFIGEGYGIWHRTSGRTWTTFGGFVTAGYAVTHQVTPYVRVERIVTLRGVDPFFVPDRTAPGEVQLDILEGIAGMRFDVSTWSAVKAEYVLTRLIDDEETYHAGTVSWQFALLERASGRFGTAAGEALGARPTKGRPQRKTAACRRTKAAWRTL